MSNNSVIGTSVYARLMSRKFVAILTVLVLAVSLACFMPTTSSAPPKTIRIGVIAPSTSDLDSVLTTYKQIVEPDINDYVAKLPRDRFQPQIKFQFLIENAESSAQVHLQKVQKFHKMGVDLIIGGAWSSQAAGSLDYVNEHDMLLISYSSTSPSLAIPDDNLFRLCPDDSRQGKAIAEMLLSKGVTSAIVIQRDDLWANDIYDTFEPEYVAGGGTILTRQQYSTETSDFTTYLEAAEAEATGASDEGVLILSFDEAAILITQAQSYPIIYDLLWFGTDGTALSYAILGGAPEQACHLKIYSTRAGVTPETASSQKYTEMATRYETLVGRPWNFYASCEIDAGWILAQAVLETQRSIVPKIIGTEIAKVLPDICSRYFGYSGWCLLNEAGDRMPGNYDIWGYGKVDDVPSHVNYGYYNCITGQVVWYPIP